MCICVFMCHLWIWIRILHQHQNREMPFTNCFLPLLTTIFEIPIDDWYELCWKKLCQNNSLLESVCSWLVCLNLCNIFPFSYDLTNLNLFISITFFVCLFVIEVLIPALFMCFLRFLNICQIFKCLQFNSLTHTLSPPQSPMKSSFIS